MSKQREEVIALAEACGFHTGTAHTVREGKKMLSYYAYPEQIIQFAAKIAAAMQPEIDLANGLLHEEQSTTAQLRDIIHGYFENKIKLEQQLSAANQRNKELQSENETCRNLMRIKQEQNDAFNQRIEELEANLNQVRSTYNQIIAEDTATRNEYLDEIAKLEERIRVADAEEPYAWECTSYGQATRLTKVWDIAQFYAPCTKLYLHAQIPAEVELKEKIVELEAIIKEQP